MPCGCNNISTCGCNFVADTPNVSINKVGNQVRIAVSTQSGASYIHEQAVPSLVWHVVHNLGRLGPNVTVIDSAGERVFSGADYIDNNTLELTFGVPFGGIAIVGG